jgi:hypothetical protein
VVILHVYKICIQANHNGTVAKKKSENNDKETITQNEEKHNYVTNK